MTTIHSKSGRQKFWEDHIAQCSASALSQAEYCRLNKISLKSFQYWKRKAKHSGTTELIEVPLPQTFPIPVFPSTPPLCLVIGRQYRIEIGRGFDSEDLARVVKTLGRI